MRIVLMILITAPLAACAATGSNRYQTELDALESACSARGGVLRPAPTAGRTDRPALDYYCQNPVATRLPQG